MSNAQVFYKEAGQFWGTVSGVCLLCFGTACFDEMRRNHLLFWAWVAGVTLLFGLALYCWLWLRRGQCGERGLFQFKSPRPK